MSELPYVVECKMSRYFEPIAAFNSRRAAQDYADECIAHNGSMGFIYRVVVKEERAA